MKKEAINSVLYLITCKENYFNKIWPSDPSIKNNLSYKTLLDIACQYIELGRLSEIAGFLMESQYCINLWTAHFILEYGKPDELLKVECLNIIQDYSVSELQPTIADLESKWLVENVGKYF